MVTTSQEDFEKGRGKHIEIAYKSVLRLDNPCDGPIANAVPYYQLKRFWVQGNVYILFVFRNSNNS